MAHKIGIRRDLQLTTLIERKCDSCKSRKFFSAGNFFPALIEMRIIFMRDQVNLSRCQSPKSKFRNEF